MGVCISPGEQFHIDGVGGTDSAFGFALVLSGALSKKKVSAAATMETRMEAPQRIKTRTTI